MLKLIDLYFANSGWDADTPLTLSGCINVAEIHAHEAAEIYGECKVVWFNDNTVELM